MASHKIETRARRKKLTLIAKSNVMNSGVFWREVVDTVAKDFPDVSMDYQHVDNASMQLITNPRQFDVLACSNLFGDILSDEAAMVTGSLGMLPSASLGEGGIGLYEPVHGSAPDIAGQDRANPLAAILSAAMLLEHSLDAPAAAATIRNAVSETLAAGHRTADLAGVGGGGTPIGCRRMGELVLERVERA